MKVLRFTLFFAALLMLFTSCELEPQYVVTNNKGGLETFKSEGKVLRLIADWKKDTSVQYIVLTVDGDTSQIWKRGQ